MKTALCLLIVLILRPWNLGNSDRDYFAIWNIGQGSWATLVSARRCLHFDMGGEKGRWPQAVNQCLTRPNFLYVSHTDFDHISNIGLYMYRARDLCLARPPRDLALPKTSPKKMALFKKLTPCPAEPAAHEIEFNISAKDPNALSRIYRYGQFLLPGDSSSSAEKIWAPLLEDPNSPTAQLKPAQILVLGHHGSRTSTSDLLLYHLPDLKVAVASARRAKYGHPHIETVARLAVHKIPLLITQKWGHLLFEI